MILGAFAQHICDVEVGATYRRKGMGSAVETAQVLEVASDKMGIPHVRFKLHVSRGVGQLTVESRTLALDAFQQRFSDRIHEAH